MSPRSFADLQKDADHLNQAAQQGADEVVLRKITKYCEDFAKFCKRNIGTIVLEVKQRLNQKEYPDESIEAIDNEVSELLYELMDHGKDHDRFMRSDTLQFWVNDAWGGIYAEVVKDVSMKIVRKVAIAMDVRCAELLTAGKK